MQYGNRMFKLSHWSEGHGEAAVPNVKKKPLASHPRHISKREGPVLHRLHLTLCNRPAIFQVADPPFKCPRRLFWATMGTMLPGPQDIVKPIWTVYDGSSVWRSGLRTAKRLQLDQTETAVWSFFRSSLWYLKTKDRKKTGLDRFFVVLKKTL